MGPGARAWLLAHPIIPLCCLILNVFFNVVHTRLGFSYPLILGVSHYVCNQPLDFMKIHLLCCKHGGERTASHDVMQNVFMIVAKDVGFHVAQEQTPILPPRTL